MTETQVAPAFAYFGVKADPDCLRYPDHGFRGGFGVDLPVDVETALLHALAKPPARSFQQRLRDRLSDNAAAVDEWNRITISWYGPGSIPIDSSLIDRITPHLNWLRRACVFDDLTFRQVTFNPRQPSEFYLPPLKVVQRWQHFAFAHAIVGDRLPHLRLEEMKKYPETWRRLEALGRRYLSMVHDQPIQNLNRELVRQEQISLLLAIYERLLFLAYEYWRGEPAYRQAVSERAELTPEERAVRAVVYDGFLYRFTVRCVSELEGLIRLET